MFNIELHVASQTQEVICTKNNRGSPSRAHLEEGNSQNNCLKTGETFSKWPSHLETSKYFSRAAPHAVGYSNPVWMCPRNELFWYA